MTNSFDAHPNDASATTASSDNPRDIWIKAGPTTAAFHVADDKRLEQIRFGSAFRERQGEAYLPLGDTLLDAALGATHADGNVSTRLEYQSHTERALDANVVETRIELSDPIYPFLVTLCFKAYQTEGVLEQWVEVHHQESGNVELTRFASAAPSFGDGDFYLSQFHGSWANEMNLREEKLAYGTKTLASRRIARAQEDLALSFLLAVGAPAQENEGEVLGATLAYSGSFQLQFEVAHDHKLRVLCGSNPENVRYQLVPGETFRTPPMLWCYSEHGRGEIARRFARWGRAYGVRDGQKTRDILLNNWEATYFDFDEAKLVHLFDDARDLGMELFLLDDGWFGNKYPRDSDRQGLGDWQVTETKLPQGLGYLTAEAAKRGLRFGLWLEPEMVNPKSALFEAHPDWAIQLPHRELSLSRNQLVLDLTNPAVQQWVFETVSRILTDTPGISFVKWDCNRSITQPGSPYLPPQKQSQLDIEYNRALYAFMDRVATAHPDVEIMICAGGGGRVDYGALRYGQEFWPSDNTDPLRRVFLQWGYQQFFPTNAIAAHVTDMGKRPLKFAFDVAMSARLGMDLDTTRLSADDKAFARAAITTYKTLRDTVQLGDVYRLESPYDGARASQITVAADRRHAVCFAWQLHDGAASPLGLQGLEPDTRYHVQEVNLKPGQATQVAEDGQTLTGATLMQTGLSLLLQKQFDSAIVELTAQ